MLKERYYLQYLPPRSKCKTTHFILKFSVSYYKFKKAQEFQVWKVHLVLYEELLYDVKL